MVENLKAFVNLDIPFLQEERSKRLADLDSAMNRADITTSEKFRRILEVPIKLKMNMEEQLKLTVAFKNVKVKI